MADQFCRLCCCVRLDCQLARLSSGQQPHSAAGGTAWLTVCGVRLSRRVVSCGIVPCQAAWQLVVPSASSAVPVARLGMASACFSSAGLWYIYGGWTAAANSSSSTSAFLSDLWSYSFDNSSWQLVVQPQPATEAPPPRTPTSHTSYISRHTAARSARWLLIHSLHCAASAAMLWQCWTPKPRCRTSCYSSTSRPTPHPLHAASHTADAAPTDCLLLHRRCCVLPASQRLL